MPSGFANWCVATCFALLWNQNKWHVRAYKAEKWQVDGVVVQNAAMNSARKTQLKRNQEDFTQYFKERKLEH